MDKKKQQGNSSCSCQGCRTEMRPASIMKRGDLVYCPNCGASYFLDALDPVRLIPSSHRKFETPWQDGCEFI